MSRRAPKEGVRALRLRPGQTIRSRSRTSPRRSSWRAMMGGCARRMGSTASQGAADCDVIHPATPPATQAGNQSKPKRDLVLSEGQPVVLGDQSVMVTAIPGHTPGSLAFIFRVTDRGTTYSLGLFGGTILTADRI